METGPAHNEPHRNIYKLILMLIENAASSSRSPPPPTDGIALTAITKGTQVGILGTVVAVRSGNMEITTCLKIRC